MSHSHLFVMLCSSLLALAAASAPALAQGDPGGHDHRAGPPGRWHEGPPRHEGPGRHHHGEFRPPQPPRIVRLPPPPPRPYWGRGQYYHGPIRVVDYRMHRLRPPPPGYRWVRDDRGDFLMVAIATGIIADLILHR